MNNEIAFAEPLVSLCIPTYNRAAKLKRAVEKLIIGRDMRQHNAFRDGDKGRPDNIETAQADRAQLHMDRSSAAGVETDGRAVGSAS